MTPLTWIEKLGGRKFLLAMVCVASGAGMTVAGMLLSMRTPELAPQIVLLVGSFNTVLMVAVSLFTATNTAATMVDRWKQGGPPAVVTESEATERIRETGAMPAVTVRTATTKVTEPVATTVVEPERGD